MTLFNPYSTKALTFGTNHYRKPYGGTPYYPPPTPPSPFIVPPNPTIGGHISPPVTSQVQTSVAVPSMALTYNPNNIGGTLISYTPYRPHPPHNPYFDFQALHIKFPHHMVNNMSVSTLFNLPLFNRFKRLNS
jgi:hypothetical protein